MKFSIIIPVYNAEKYLQAALDSVVNQTFTDWEAICVDDGSIDGSGAILDYYAAKDSRFKVVHKKNEGVAIARNVGLDNAIGELITWLDADDMYAPWRLEEAKEIIEKERPDIVRFSVIMAKDMPKNGFARKQYKIYEGGAAKDWAWNVLMPVGMMWTFVARRELFENNRFIPGMRIKEEAPVVARIANRIKKIVQSESKAYFYRQIPTSAMKSKRRAEDCLNLLNSILLILREGTCGEVSAKRLRMHAECDIIDWVVSGEDVSRIKEIYCKWKELKQAGVFDCKTIQQIRYRLPMWWWDKTGQVWMIRVVNLVIICIMRAIRWAN